MSNATGTETVRGGDVSLWTINIFGQDEDYPRSEEEKNHSQAPEQPALRAHAISSRMVSMPLTSGSTLLARGVLNQAVLVIARLRHSASRG